MSNKLQKGEFKVISTERTKPAYLLAEFASVGDITNAIRETVGAGYTRWDAHTPFPIHELSGLERKKTTVYRWFIFLSGVSGAVVAILLQWYTNAVDYPFLISGKPYFSLPANIPVAFELTILFSALGAFLGMLAFNGLPMFSHPLFRSGKFKRATTDKFFISIDSSDPNFALEDTENFLRSVGAESVEHIFYPSPSSYLIPRGVVLTFIAIGAISLIPLANVGLARARRSDAPRPSFIPDMDKQQKFKVQEESELFADGMAMRLPVPGSVARGELRDDDRFYRGKIGGEWVRDFPIPVTFELMKRGRERFEIYCAPCHGIDGSGVGMTAKRAEELEQAKWVPPANLHDGAVRAREVGHLFNTISNGIRSMPPYGRQIPTLDRWAIVAYIRALQRSQRAALDDVSEWEKVELEANN